jgi:hypothetical protein
MLPRELRRLGYLPEKQIHALPPEVKRRIRHALLTNPWTRKRAMAARDAELLRYFGLLRAHRRFR